MLVILAAAAGPAAAEEPLTTGWVPLPPGMGDVVTADPASQILYLNRCRGGCDINAGRDDSRTNSSSIPWSDSHLDPFPHGDTAWTRVVDCVRALYAPFGIEVTDVDPGPEVNHFEAMVAGDPEDVGMPGNVGGVAPFACGVIENAITFTFAGRLNGPQMICEVVGQESAHAFGLDHEMLCEDPMTYLANCGPKCFRDEVAACGEYEERECSCGGAGQNSYAYLMQIFGPGQPLEGVRFESPHEADLVEPGFHLRVEPMLPCVRTVSAWIEAKGGDIFLGEVASWPYVLNTPDDLPLGPVTIRVLATGADGAEATSTLNVTVSDQVPDAGVRPQPDAGTGAEGGGGGCAAGGAAGPAAGLALLVLAAVRRRRYQK